MTISTTMKPQSIFVKHSTLLMKTTYLISLPLLWHVMGLSIYVKSGLKKHSNSIEVPQMQLSMPNRIQKPMSFQGWRKPLQGMDIVKNALGY